MEHQKPNKPFQKQTKLNQTKTLVFFAFWFLEFLKYKNASFTHEGQVSVKVSYSATFILKLHIVGLTPLRV